MPIIRRVFGPFHPEIVQEEKLDGLRMIRYQAMRWYFNGIRGDKTTAHWSLTFDPNARIFSATNIRISDRMIGRSRTALISAGIKPEVTSEDAHPDAWLDDSPVMEGRISDILKSKLTSEDIAKATALAILKGK